MVDKFVSGGTYSLQNQPGGSYPETFYNGRTPLDDRLFRTFNKTCPPLTAFSACDEYASVGGVTQPDLIEENRMNATCDPMLPLDQNQYSESHYAGPFCISDCKESNKPSLTKGLVTPDFTGKAMGSTGIPSASVAMDSRSIDPRSMGQMPVQSAEMSFSAIATIAALFLLLVFISRNK